MDSTCALQVEALILPCKTLLIQTLWFGRLELIEIELAYDSGVNLDLIAWESKSIKTLIL